MLKESYKGDFSMDLTRHGKGVLTWGNGDVYEGDFNNGMRYVLCTVFKLCTLCSILICCLLLLIMSRHGTGKYTDKLTKTVYAGTFVSGEKSNGTLTYPNGDTYTGKYFVSHSYEPNYL